MTTIGTDEALWRSMSAAAREAAPRGDVRVFVRAVKSLSGAGSAVTEPAAA
jgi:hypothetical protein